VARWELNGSKVNPYIIRKPVFLIDEKLANEFNLKRIKSYNLGTVSTILIKTIYYVLCTYPIK